MPCKKWSKIEKLVDDLKGEMKGVCDSCDCEEPEPVCYPEYKGKGNHPDFPDDKPVEGERFDHHWYLKQYPDVAAGECYGIRPYCHFCFHGREEGRLPYYKEPDPSPPLLPKMRKFVPDGEPQRFVKGGDNGIVTTDEDGNLFMVVGDVPVGNVKYETAIYKNGTFIRGLRGKCYGALCIGKKLYLLQSDKGSMWEGVQNCRIYDYDANKRSFKTLQDTLKRNSGNWFFVNIGHGYKGPPMNDHVFIGCLQWKKPKFYELQSPVTIYQGSVDNVDSFKKIGDCSGLRGPRRDYATTCSITYIPERGQYVAGIGDFVTSIIYQFTTQGDYILGPWALVGEDRFSPPMKREHETNDKGETFWTGPFTLCHYKGKDDRWYESISGHSNNDEVWTRLVRAEVPR